MVNPATSRFCSRCRLPLTEEAIQEIEEWGKRKVEAFNELTNITYLAEWGLKAKDFERISLMRRSTTKQSISNSVRLLA